MTSSNPTTTSYPTNTNPPPSNIYYPIPKMNPKNIFNLVPLYSSSTTNIHQNSVHYFLKDFQDRSINYPSFSSKKIVFQSSKKKPQDIEKEWSKLNPLLIQLHLFHHPLNFLSNLDRRNSETTSPPTATESSSSANPLRKEPQVRIEFFKGININDSSWNFIHYFPLVFSNQPTTPSAPINHHLLPNNKYSAPSLGLFLLPHSFYLSSLQSADLILSLYDISEEQTVYLTLFALLVQNHKGSFVLKIQYFYTPLMMDLLFLLSCVYNKIIILPVDYVHFYVVCKGFQNDILKPHYEHIKSILHTMRPNSLQRIINLPSNHDSTNPNASLRIFSNSLPSLFSSKIEEINVLIHHKQLIAMND